ncbi:hypothetical protein SAMN02927921_01390 [Sinomicrobium oceani]|uniref:Bacteriocin-type signal sequence-containing protein n=1 Tax=Sinomicrobium oceani TaxID=1150368 RepID=A0A1K1NR51_9FLAO|nr:hypothetical protein [Sinomicrobium oceani]SFW37780.1 hypothetical protein SAMN02927921_01390 [Sinomicrobium oceani]
MKDLRNYKVTELSESELHEINGGLDLGVFFGMLQGIVDIVNSHMQAALDAVQDFISDFLEGV